MAACILCRILVCFHKTLGSRSIANSLSGCGNSTLISALNSDDSGTTNLLNALFNLPDYMVAAAFGAKGNATGFGASVPAIGTGAALGSAECRAKCGLD